MPLCLRVKSRGLPRCSHPYGCTNGSARILPQHVRPSDSYIAPASMRRTVQKHPLSWLDDGVDWWQNRSHERHALRDRRPSVSEITPHLLIGEYPRVEDISWLKET